MYNYLYRYLEERDFPNFRELKSKGVDKEFVENLKHATSFLDNSLSKVPNGIRLTCVVEGIKAIPECIVCGASVSISRTVWSNEHYSIGFSRTCSSKCHHARSDVRNSKMATEDEYRKRSEKRKETCMSRYGVDHVSKTQEVVEKRKETNMKKFGVPTNLLDEGNISKSKNTMVERYGVEHHMKSETVKEKIKKTCEDRYGVKNYVESDEFKIKATKTNNERYGGHPMKSVEVKRRMKENSLQTNNREYPNQLHIPAKTIEALQNKAAMVRLYEKHKNLTKMGEQLGVSFSTVQRACASLGVEVDKRFMTSLGENQIAEFLDSIGVEYTRNRRDIINGELDIVIDSINVAIEFNGIFWHSDRFKHKYYHQEKSLECMKKGILLIHVWEDDWVNEESREIVKSKILSKIQKSPNRVFARKTNVEFIESKEAREFLDVNHIQGKTTATYWIGLRHGSELVACLGLKKTKDSGVLDLVRYSTSKVVVGGFSKCLKFATKSLKWRKIFTFASLDYSHGDVYEKAGFTKVKTTVPGMWYVKGNNRFRREKYMKHKLKDVIPNFDKSKTEKQNMTDAGFVRLFDAGSIRYEIEKSPH